MRRHGVVVPFSEALAPGQFLRDSVVAIGDVLRDCDFPLSLQYARSARVLEDWKALLELLATGVSPSVVISAAVSDDVDCMDIAQLLHRFRYAGRYYVLANALPDPEVVLCELVASFPELDIEIVSVPPRCLVSYS